MNRPLEEKEIRIFDLFQNQWGLVAAGTPEEFNCCTVSWGSMGTLWTRPGKTGSVITVYLHPSRYTRQFVQNNDTFTVSFFGKEHQKALAYVGSRSGRNGDKITGSGLTPEAFGGSVAFKEARETYLCRKIYQHQFTKEDLAEDVQQYYLSNPGVYPPDENGQWQPHWVFVGEVLDVKE